MSMSTPLGITFHPTRRPKNASPAGPDRYHPAAHPDRPSRRLSATAAALRRPDLRCRRPGLEPGHRPPDRHPSTRRRPPHRLVRQQPARRLTHHSRRARPCPGPPRPHHPRRPQNRLHPGRRPARCLHCRYDRQTTDGTYKFIGEILYTHGDKPDHPPTPTGEVAVDPLGPGTARLLTGIKDRNIPLMTHWEAWAWDPGAARFDQLYAAWPNQRFLLASLAYGSADKAEHVLAAHQNVWGIISRVVDGRYTLVDPAKQAKLGPPMTDACGTLRPEWRSVLTKHAGRLLYGSDAYATRRVSWDVYPGIIERYRRVAGQLPPGIARRISWDNAAALHGVR